MATICDYSHETQLGYGHALVYGVWTYAGWHVVTDASSLDFQADHQFVGGSCDE